MTTTKNTPYLLCAEIHDSGSNCAMAAILTHAQTLEKLAAIECNQDGEQFLLDFLKTHVESERDRPIVLSTIPAPGFVRWGWSRLVEAYEFLWIDMPTTLMMRQLWGDGEIDFGTGTTPMDSAQWQLDYLHQVRTRFQRSNRTRFLGFA